MKRKLLSLLTLSLVVITSSSCLLKSKPQTTTPIIHTKVVKSSILTCPKPEEPTYEKLDENKPLVSPDNIAKLLNNIAKMKQYCKALEEVIRCYEEQINIDKSTSEVTNHGKEKVERIRK